MRKNRRYHTSTRKRRNRSGRNLAAAHIWTSRRCRTFFIIPERCTVRFTVDDDEITGTKNWQGIRIIRIRFRLGSIYFENTRTAVIWIIMIIITTMEIIMTTSPDKFCNEIQFQIKLNLISVVLYLSFHKTKYTRMPLKLTNKKRSWNTTPKQDKKFRGHIIQIFFFFYFVLRVKIK